MNKSHIFAPADRLGINRDEAAEFIGVTADLFEEMVEDRLMPRPRKVGHKRIWSRPELEKAFALLETEDEYEIHLPRVFLARLSPNRGPTPE